jgi:hypothetical protein
MIMNEPTPPLPQVSPAEFQQVLDDLARGIRRPEQMKAACERMDQMREENRALLGEQNLAVGLIREIRGEP